MFHGIIHRPRQFADQPARNLPIRPRSRLPFPEQRLRRFILRLGLYSRLWRFGCWRGYRRRNRQRHRAASDFPSPLSARILRHRTLLIVPIFKLHLVGPRGNREPRIVLLAFLVRRAAGVVRRGMRFQIEHRHFHSGPSGQLIMTVSGDSRTEGIAGAERFSCRISQGNLQHRIMLGRHAQLHRHLSVIPEIDDHRHRFPDLKARTPSQARDTKAHSIGPRRPDDPRVRAHRFSRLIPPRPQQWPRALPFKAGGVEEAVHPCITHPRFGRKVLRSILIFDGSANHRPENRIIVERRLWSLKVREQAKSAVTNAAPSIGNHVTQHLQTRGIRRLRQPRLYQSR